MPLDKFALIFIFRIGIAAELALSRLDGCAEDLNAGNGLVPDLDDGN